MSGLRRVARKFRLGALCAALLTLCLLSAPPAQAAEHPFLEVAVRGAPDGSGGIAPFEGLCGVTLGAHGDIYLSDYYHHVIDVFEGGTFRAAITPGTVNSACDLAVDSNGRLYANNWHEDVARYTPNDYPFSVSLPLGYGAPFRFDPSPRSATGVAIDPASDRVYIDEGDRIGVFEPSGAPVLDGGLPLWVGVGSLGEGYGLAVSAYPGTAGYVYVADASNDTVKVYDPATDPAEPLAVIDGAGTPQGGFNDLTDADVAIDELDGHVYVVDNLEPGFEHPEAVVDELGRFGAYQSQIAHRLVHGEPSGLEIGQFFDEDSGEFRSQVYVTSGNDEGAVLYKFGSAPPTVTKDLRIVKSGSGDGSVTSQPAGIDCGSACGGEFEPGQAVTLVATGDDRSQFKGWTLAGSPGTCSGTGACEVAVTADLEVSAEFESLPQQLLTVSKDGTGTGTIVSQPSGIDCGLVCAGEFSDGSTVTLTAAPQPRSSFAGWSVAGAPGACAGTGPCELTLSAATEVTAGFAAIPQQTLSVTRTGSGQGTVASAPAGIDCGAACSAAFDQGSTVTLTATAAAGSRFTGFSGGGCSGSATCQVQMGTATAVSADFEAIRHDLSVAISGRGRVVSQPAGIDCGAVCTGVFDAGAQVTLVPVPAPGFRLSAWGGGGCSGTRECRVDLAADSNVRVSFEPVRRSLAISLAGTGTGTVTSAPAGIACGSGCAGLFDQGTTVTLTAAAAPGSTFRGWGGCSSATGNRCTVTLAGNGTVNAVFDESVPLVLGRATVKGATAVLRVTVPGPGTLSALAKRLKPAKVRAKRQGTVALSLALNRAGRRALAKRGRLEAKVALTFSPRDGAPPVTATKAVTFHSKGRSR